MRTKKWSRWLMGSVAVALAACALVMGVPAAASRWLQARTLPQLSKSLGVPVTARVVQVKLWPLGARLVDLKVGAPEQPLLSIGELTVGFDLATWLASFGKRVRVGPVRLASVSVRLVQGSDGRWQQLPVVGGTPRPSRTRLELHDVQLSEGSLELQARGQRWKAEQIQARVEQLGRGLPIPFALDAAVDSAQPNVHAAGELGMEPGAPRRIHLRVDKIALQPFEAAAPPTISERFCGGKGTADLVVTVEGSRWRVDGSLVVEDARLGQEPLGLRASGSVAVERGRGMDGVSGDLNSIEVHGPGIELAGKLRLQGDKIALTAEGPLLDMRTLIRAVPRVRIPYLHRVHRRALLSRLQGEGDVKIDRLMLGPLTATQFTGHLALRAGRLMLERGEARLYSGSLRGDGSEIDLGGPIRAWRVRAALKNVQVGSALRDARVKRRVSGVLSGALDARAAGTSLALIRRSLSGWARLAAQHGVVRGVDLGAEVRGRLRGALEVLGAPNADAPPSEPDTAIDALTVALSARQGVLSIGEPVVFDSTVGQGAITGIVDLKDRLDLTGQLMLAPEFVTEATGGLLRPDAPVELPWAVDGRLRHPAVHWDVGAVIGSLILPDPKQSASKRAQALDNAAEQGAAATKRQVKTDQKTSGPSRAGRALPEPRQ